MSEYIGAVTSTYEQDALARERENARNDPPSVMMMLGDFEFSINTATFNQLAREASWRWPEQERIGKQDLLQYTGKAARSVKFDGETHAFFRNGTASIDTLYALADKAAPQLLVSGAGDVLGYWVVTEFSDNTPSFLRGGGPRKRTYSMTIKHYADDLSNV